MIDWLDWQPLLHTMSGCTLCGLSAERHTVVSGEGDREAALMFIGEGPGADEDAQGRPFVGRAGQLLDRMINAMGLQREEVYIANVVKCRPPGNRTPAPKESAACLPYLRNQVALIRPSVIVLLGATAANAVADPKIRITRDRGQWIQRNGYWLMPTFHPAALLRDPDRKREVWIDLKAVREKMQELNVWPEGRTGAK